MATDLWFTTSTDPAAPDIGIASERLLSFTVGTSTSNIYIHTTTVAGPTGPVPLTGTDFVAWFTPPLAAVTISGTITFNLCGVSNSMNANAGWQVKVDRCSNTGAVLSTLVNSEAGVETPVSQGPVNWTATPTSTSLSAGDRVKVTLYINDAGGTMGAGFNNAFACGGLAGSIRDSWIRFTETLVEGGGSTTVPHLAGAQAGVLLPDTGVVQYGTAEA